MRAMIRACAAVLLAAGAAEAWAQPDQPATAPAPRDASSETPVADPAPSAAVIPAQQWQPGRWPELASAAPLLDLAGYLRLRGHLLDGADLRNGASPLARPPSGVSTVSGLDMRLRLEPRLRVRPGLTIAGTLDVLDNLVLGSTPRGLTQAGVALLERGQEVPRAGANALSDSLHVRRLWGEIELFEGRGQLLAGRVPAHAGLGMLYNNGNGLDHDLGDDVDRLQVLFKLGELTVAPTYDTLASGLLRRPSGQRDGQLLDLDNLDDAFELSLPLARRDGEAQIAEHLARGQTVLNGTLMPFYRRQARQVRLAAADTYDPLAVPDLPSWDLLYRVDGRVYGLDLWGLLATERLRLEFEAALLYLQYTHPDGLATRGLQYGAAFESTWRPSLPGRLILTFDAGLASGDPQALIGSAAADPGSDGRDDLFAFHRSYQVDLLLFRVLVGGVRGAWYAKPGARYRLSDRVGAAVSALYGQALERAATPSGSSAERGQLPLGLELDAELFVVSDGLVSETGYACAWREHETSRGLVGSLAYGLLVPLGAWRNPALPFARADPVTMAHAVQARLAILF